MTSTAMIITSHPGQNIHFSTLIIIMYNYKRNILTLDQTVATDQTGTYACESIHLEMKLNSHCKALTSG